jgi:hypothetical protein
MGPAPAVPVNRDFWLCRGRSAALMPCLTAQSCKGTKRREAGRLARLPRNCFRLGRCYHLPPSEQPALPPVLQVYGFTKLPAVFVIVNVLPDFEVPTTT